MYTAIIIDDEAKIRQVLKIKLEQYCQQISTLYEAVDVEDAYQKINEHHPDLIYLDISMPGASGFDLLNKLSEIDFEIIFCTGYDLYAIEAMKLSAVDYLLKPIKTEELINATNKALERIENKQKIKNYDTLKNNLEQFDVSDSSKIAIPGAGSYDFINVNDVIRCQGWNKYTKIFLSSGEVIISSYNIGIFNDFFSKYNFFVCHKSHLINLKHVQKYYKKGILIMSDDEQIPLARRRKEEFLKLVSDQSVIS